MYPGESHCYVGMQWLCVIMRRGWQRKRDNRRKESAAQAGRQAHPETVDTCICWDFPTDPLMPLCQDCLLFHSCLLPSFLMVLFLVFVHNLIGP